MNLKVGRVTPCAPFPAHRSGAHGVTRPTCRKVQGFKARTWVRRILTPELAVQRQDQQVVYFNGHLPVFTHSADDLASFRLFTTQLIVNGTATQGQIAKGFGVPLRTIKRCVQRYRQRGAHAFFAPAPKRQGHRLTPERLAQAQGLLDGGQSVPQISAQLGVLATTLHKALDHGRLKLIKKKPCRPRHQQ